MKQTWKKLVSLAAAGILAVSLTACGSSKKEINQAVAANLYQGTVQTVTELVSYDSASLEQAIEENPGMDKFVKDAFISWMAASEELGALEELSQEMTDETIRRDGSKYIVTLDAKFEKRDAVVEMVYSSKLAPESVGFSANYSMGEKMKEAGMNTIVGLAIVFLMLVFLSFIISLMKFIPGLVESFGKKKAPAAEAPAPIAETVPVVEEELADDGALVAVIAAAIAASEGTSTDGFVVRSIRKSNKRNWR